MPKFSELKPNLIQLRKGYLTIIPRARMGCESIDHEAEGLTVY